MTFTYQLQVLHCCSLQSVRSKCHVIRQERIYHEKFCGLAHVFCIVHIFYCTNTLHVPLIIKHLAIASEECFVCWLVLPFRERNNFIQLSKNIIVLFLQIFNAWNCIIFTISASGLFLKYSLNFANFSLDILIKYIL